MRWSIPAGALIALAFLVPTAPAVAQTESPRTVTQTESPGLNEDCEPVERKVYKDLRNQLSIDLDNAHFGELRLLASRILHEAHINSFNRLSDGINEGLEGTEDELRAYLRADVQDVWHIDLRIRVNQTVAPVDTGPEVEDAGQKALDDGSVDAFLAYLNDGLYVARARDCASRPTPTPSVSPTASPTATATAAPTPTSSASAGVTGGEGGGLPKTGAETATVAGIGGALLLLGGAGYLIGRRRRTRFLT